MTCTTERIRRTIRQQPMKLVSPTTSKGASGNFTKHHKRIEQQLGLVLPCLQGCIEITFHHYTNTETLSPNKTPNDVHTSYKYICTPYEYLNSQPVQRACQAMPQGNPIANIAQVLRPNANIAPIPISIPRQQSYHWRCGDSTQTSNLAHNCL